MRLQNRCVFHRLSFLINKARSSVHAMREERRAPGQVRGCEMALRNQRGGSRPEKSVEGYRPQKAGEHDTKVPSVRYFRRFFSLGRTRTLCNVRYVRKITFYTNKHAQGSGYSHRTG